MPEEEIKWRKEKEIRKVAKVLIKNMKDVTLEDWIKTVRESRNER